MSAVLNNANLDVASLPHGGDLARWQRQEGDQASTWLDLSSACNREPWPIPDFPKALWMALPDQAALMQSAQSYYGVRPTVIASGSQQIIEALPILKREQLTSECNPSNRVFVPRIGYQEHAFAWQKWGFELAYYDDLRELLDQSWTAAVLVNPNNPTGEWTDSELALNVLAHAKKQQAWFVVDEAFIDVQPEFSLLNRLGEHIDEQIEGQHGFDALFVLRSVGKFFGLAGARVGFAFCHPDWQQSLNNLMGPWPVASASLHLVDLALQDTAWQLAAKDSLEARQRYFSEKVLPKFHTIFDSQDYTLHPLFVTWRLSDQGYAEQVFAMLHEVGVHTRLGDGWIRVAMPAMSEIETLDALLIRLLKGAGGRDLA
ncbi:aminotransferase class I/II-fold pyridoxal phosphate-dependent enzyme [Marinomonas posidonica]|uniref:aminotransferase class I/II-fold pyridoxal phosphate-dependent enzyme n=1 Tax=Marinomonas posidonica TaxID=936476 RepID=UPI00373656DB